jgi:hypothetical protein
MLAGYNLHRSHDGQGGESSPAEHAPLAILEVTVKHRLPAFCH